MLYNMFSEDVVKEREKGFEYCISTKGDSCVWGVEGIGVGDDNQTV